MTYTINKLAKMASVSVRTLHYYDEIGLLKPSFIAENGYRHYGEKELIQLQQILFFRELEFPLDKIKEIVLNSKFNVATAMADHKALLLEKRKRINRLLQTVDKTMEKLNKKKDPPSRPPAGGGKAGSGEQMEDKDLFNGFDEKQIEAYKKEAFERWGHTKAYKQSVERTRNYTKKDVAAVANEWEAIIQSYADNMSKGIESKEIQRVVERHWNQINKFYDCTKEIFEGLANMYVADERFASNYRKHHKKLPEFVRDAMLYYCKNK